MLIPYGQTNQMFDEWSQNHQVSEEIIIAACNEAKDVEKQEEQQAVKDYLFNIFQRLNADKKPEKLEIVAWHLASHTNRIEQNKNRIEQNKKEDEDYFTPLNRMLNALSSKDLEYFKEIKELINKTLDIKSNAEKLSPICHLHEDIRHSLVKMEGGRKLFRLAKDFDLYLQAKMINTINSNQSSFSELGFHSIAQIKDFFGKNLFKLTHISFRADRKTEIERIKYFQEQIKDDPQKNYNEQELFETFIESLEGIKSFYFNRKDVSNISIHDNLEVPKEKTLDLTLPLFLNFCKKNPQLEQLECSALPEDAEEQFKTAFTQFKCLKSLHYPIQFSSNRYNLLKYSNLHTLEELNYQTNSIEELKELVHFKKLKKLSLSAPIRKDPLFVKNMTDKILPIIRNHDIEELSIEGDISDFGSVVTGTAYLESLKKLSLKYQVIDLDAFLLYASKYKNLNDIKFTNCSIICNRDLAKLFEINSNFEFINCSYRGSNFEIDYNELLNDFKEINSEKRLVEISSDSQFGSEDGQRLIYIDNIKIRHL